MADEAEVAYRTNEIVSALSGAYVTLGNVADGAGADAFGRAMGYRMDEIHQLAPRIDELRRVERIALAATGGEEMGAADDNLQREFGKAQDDVGKLIAKFNHAEQELRDLGKDLPERSEELTAGIVHVDALEQLPAGRTEETEQLRSRLVNAQSAVENASTVLKQVEAQLEAGRLRAGRFTVVALPVTQEGLHSKAADEIRGALANDVASARGDAETLAEAITKPRDQQSNPDPALADGLRALDVGLPPARTSGAPAVSIQQSFSYKERSSRNTSHTNEL